MHDAAEPPVGGVRPFLRFTSLVKMLRRPRISGGYLGGERRLICRAVIAFYPRLPNRRLAPNGSALGLRQMRLKRRDADAVRRIVKPSQY